MLRLVQVVPVDASPPGCMRFLLESEDTRSCGEQASPHVVIDVVIYDAGRCEAKKPRQVA